MKFLRENLPLLGAIAGPMAALVAYLLNADEKLVRDIFTLVTILTVPCAVGLRTYLDRDKDHNSFYAFLRGNLVSKKSQKLVGQKTKLIIIAHKESQKGFKGLLEQFSQIKELEIEPFASDSPDKDLKEVELVGALAQADAVAIIRTKELEKQAWLVKTLNKWALKHSHLPVLIIDPKKRYGSRVSPLLGEFAFVHQENDHAASSLLKRATERAFAWRGQAVFNRLIALTLLIVMAACLIAWYLMVRNERGQNYRVLQAIYGVMAKHAKEDFQNSVLQGKDNTWNVSYWIGYQNSAYPLSSSEDGIHTIWGPDVPSIIGCSFALPYGSVSWDKNGVTPSVLPRNGERSTSNDKRCDYGKQPQRRLPSIVCASYGEDPQRPVGVCLFTENKDSNVSAEATEFANRRAKEFYDAVAPAIKDGRLIPRQ